MSDPQHDHQYNNLVIDHFERPRNAGRLQPGADVIEGTAGSVAQGVMFILSARVVADHIDALGFEAYGCPHCVAAGSWLSERLVGATRQQLQAWRWQEAADALAVSPEKRGRLLILEDAVRALAERWARQS